MNDIGEDGTSISKTQQLNDEKMELENRKNVLEVENKKLVNSITALDKKIEEYEERVDELEQELEELRDGGTPRPDWQRCGNIVEGGSDRWRKVLKGKTSDQLMGLLLDDISQLRRANRDWLEGRGTGYKVPAYLRYDGQVKNLNIDMKMVCEIIADVLKAKEERHVGISMPQFLYQYLNLKYSTETLQMEFSYNLVDGLERFKESE